MATGGTTGQVLTKASSTDFDTTWTTPPIISNWEDFTEAAFISGGDALNMVSYQWARVNGTLFGIVRVGAQTGGGTSTGIIRINVPLPFILDVQKAIGSGFFRPSGAPGNRQPCIVLAHDTLVGPNNDHTIFCIADGFGSVQGTDMASDTAELSISFNFPIDLTLI